MAAAGGAVTDRDLKRPRTLGGPDLARASRRGPATWGASGGGAPARPPAESAPAAKGRGRGGPPGEGQEVRQRRLWRGMLYVAAVVPPPPRVTRGPLVPCTRDWWPHQLTTFFEV